MPQPAAGEPYWSATDGQVDLYLGDSLQLMPRLADASFDAVVCDPDYALVFRHTGGDAAARPYRARLRTRADRRTNRADGGKSLVTVPESYSTGTAAPGGRNPYQAWCESWAGQCLRLLRPGGHLLAFGGPRTSHRLTTGIEDAGFEIRGTITWIHASGLPKNHDVASAVEQLTGDRALADQWDGWGTGLKPACTPIVLARKPLAGTVAANILEFGTGAIHVGSCRVPGGQAGEEGRWPPDLVVSHAPDCEGSRCVQGCPVPELDRQAGAAARFYPVFRFAPKAPGWERPRLPDGSGHPTPKPLGLMCWLARLAARPGGRILDPFAGSGTTGQAALVEGLRCVLIEQDPDSADLAVLRLTRPVQQALGF